MLFVVSDNEGKGECCLLYQMIKASVGGFLCQMMKARVLVFLVADNKGQSECCLCVSNDGQGGCC